MENIKFTFVTSHIFYIRINLLFFSLSHRKTSLFFAELLSSLWQIVNFYIHSSCPINYYFCSSILLFFSSLYLFSHSFCSPSLILVIKCSSFSIKTMIPSSQSYQTLHLGNKRFVFIGSMTTMLFDVIFCFIDKLITNLSDLRDGGPQNAGRVNRFAQRQN